MRVLEVLTPHVVLARRKDPLRGAIQMMREEHVGALVVVDEQGDVRKPIGMLTDRDVVVGVLAKDESHIGTLEVGDVMSADLVTATADEDLGEVLRRMRKFGVRRVPVVDAAGALEGILSIDDTVAGLAEELSEIASLLTCQRERESKKRP